MLIAAVLFAGVLLWYLYAASVSQPEPIRSVGAWDDREFVLLETARRRLAQGQIDAEEYSQAITAIRRPS